jgi:hypothetical protein
MVNYKNYKMKGERLMPKVYDRRDRYVGYVDGDSIFDRKHRFIGYIQDNTVYDANYNPVSFYYNDAFYWMNGMPWGYYDGRTVRDLNGRRLGRVKNTWPDLLSAALLLGRNTSWNQYEYENPRQVSRQDGRPSTITNNSPYPSQPQYAPQSNTPGLFGGRGLGLGGMMQNIMGVGRSMFNGFGGLGRFSPSANMPVGNPVAANIPVQNVNPGAVPVGGAAANPGFGFGMQDIMNLGRVMLNNAGGAGAASGAGGGASAAGMLGPLSSAVGQYLIKNPNMALNLLSKFMAK